MLSISNCSATCDMCGSIAAFDGADTHRKLLNRLKSAEWSVSKEFDACASCADKGVPELTKETREILKRNGCTVRLYAEYTVKRIVSSSSVYTNANGTRFKLVIDEGEGEFYLETLNCCGEKEDRRKLGNVRAEIQEAVYKAYGITPSAQI